jgi:hypothetical protein
MGAGMSYQSLPYAVQRLLDKMRWVLVHYAKDSFDEANAALGAGWDMRPPQEVIWADHTALASQSQLWDQAPFLQVWESAAPVSFVASRSQDVQYRLSISVWEMVDGRPFEQIERRAKLAVHLVAQLFAEYLPDNPTSVAGPCGIWRADIDQASMGTSRRFAGDANAIAHRATMIVSLRTLRPWGNTLMPLASLPVPFPQDEQNASLQDAGLFVTDGANEAPLGVLLAGRVTQIAATLTDSDSLILRFASSPQYVTPADGAAVVLVAQDSQRIVTGVVAGGSVTLPLTGVAAFLFGGDVTITVVDTTQNVVLGYRVNFAPVVWNDAGSWDDNALWGAP